MPINREEVPKILAAVIEIGDKHEEEIQKLVTKLTEDLGETFGLSEQELADISGFVFNRLKHDIPIFLGVGMTELGPEKLTQ